MPLKKDVACQKMIEFFLHHSQSAMALLSCSIKSSACGDIHKKRTIAPQQPHKPVLCTHKLLARLLLSLFFCGDSFSWSQPEANRNFWASLSTIVLQVGPAFLLYGLASFARPALVDFTIDNNPVDKEIIQSCFVVAADTIIFFYFYFIFIFAVRHTREQGGGA